jgi:hypothetical protein
MSVMMRWSRAVVLLQEGCVLLGIVYRLRLTEDELVDAL